MRERNSNNDIFAKSLILLNLNETKYEDLVFAVSRMQQNRL